MRFSSVFAASLALAACGVEAPEEAADGPAETEDVTLGQTEQDLSWVLATPHSCTGSACYFDLGPTTDRTCFLSGLWGSMSSGSASVLTYADGRYKLRIGAPVGRTITAFATCIAATSHRIEGFWTGGHAATPINGTVTSTRRCFLSEIDNNVTTRGFDTTSDYAQVWKDGSGQWYIGGSLSGGSNARAAATCVDVPNDNGLWGIVANPGGDVGFDLAENVGGVACGLTKLGGNFTTNSGSDGLGINYNAGTRFWNIRAVNGKQATTICVR